MSYLASLASILPVVAVTLGTFWAVILLSESQGAEQDDYDGD